MIQEKIKELKKKIQAAKSADRELAEEIYDLALLGCWARDIVMPLLRKLPPATEMLLPPAKEGEEPVKTTIEAQVAEAFKVCPQKE